MDYQIDMQKVITDLADHGQKVLVEAILLDAEEAQSSISPITAPDPQSSVARQADELLLTIYNWLVNLVTGEDCKQGREALIASETFCRSQSNPNPLSQALYYYQLACADLVQVITEDPVPTACRVMENLVEFWCCWWAGRPKEQIRQDRLAYLQDYLYTWRQETHTLAPLPRAVGESRSRPSALAS